MRILAVTGYKPFELNIHSEKDPRIEFLKKAIENRLIRLIEEGLEWVVISGQMGVEMWTAEVVIGLRDTYDIKLAVFPPFENQEARWPNDYQAIYQDLSIAADFFQSLYKGNYQGPYQFKAKDLWLVKKSDAALILMDEDYPASVGYFLETARQTKSYPIYTITPADIEDTIEEIRMSDPGYWE